jgi:hypothetical protein
VEELKEQRERDASVLEEPLLFILEELELRPNV